jgi:hypothetical protein
VGAILSLNQAAASDISTNKLSVTVSASEHESIHIGNQTCDFKYVDLVGFIMQQQLEVMPAWTAQCSCASRSRSQSQMIHLDRHGSYYYSPFTEYPKVVFIKAQCRMQWSTCKHRGLCRHYQYHKLLPGQLCFIQLKFVLDC